MKAIELVFKTEAQLTPADGMSVAKTLKQVIINVASAGVQKDAPALRILWRALDDLEASGDDEVVKIGQAEFDLLKQAFEAHLPQAGMQGWKWMQAADKIMQAAKEIKE